MYAIYSCAIRLIFPTIMNRLGTYNSHPLYSSKIFSIFANPVGRRKVINYYYPDNARRVFLIKLYTILCGNSHGEYRLRRLYATLHSAKTKEYEGRKLVGFSMDQIFSVVADVGNYKYFVPFCKKSDIVSTHKDFLKAELVIGFPPITESYTSKVRTVRPRLVRAECTDGKLFNHLNTLWIFSEGLKNNAQTCVIDFSLSFEFRSVIHSHLSNLLFNEIVRQMENAFLEEAAKRYGRPCIRPVRLQR